MNHNRKIVILEDDLFYGKLIKNFLIEQKYKNVELFQDESDCLNAVDKDPTVYIVDHHLKKTIGLDVMEKIKEKNSNAQFIYLSGQEQSNVAIKALRLGVVEYIEKDNDALPQLKKTLEEQIH